MDFLDQWKSKGFEKQRKNTKIKSLKPSYLMIWKSQIDINHQFSDYQTIKPLVSLKTNIKLIWLSKTLFFFWYTSRKKSSSPIFSRVFLHKLFFQSYWKMRTEKIIIIDSNKDHSWNSLYLESSLLSSRLFFWGVFLALSEETISERSF